MPQLIATAVGPDRPGLVGELTAHLHKAGANLLDTRMVNLRGQFALMLLFDVQGNADAVKADLPTFGKTLGLSLAVSPVDGVSSSRVSGLRYQLKTYSLDQPGIVARISAVLRGHGVNIEELSAWQQNAAFAGEQLFLTEMRLTVPTSIPVAQLRSDLGKLCGEMNCDIDLEPEQL